MSYKNNNKYSSKNNNNNKNKKSFNVQQDLTYKPTLFGKIALCFAVPAAIIGIISIVLSLIISSLSGMLFLVSLAAEAVAFVGAICIVIDIVIHNKKTEKQLERTGQIPKKEKDIANLIHFVVGLGIGILLGYLFWGIN